MSEELGQCEAEGDNDARCPMEAAVERADKGDRRRASSWIGSAWDGSALAAAAQKRADSGTGIRCIRLCAHHFVAYQNGLNVPYALTNEERARVHAEHAVSLELQRAREAIDAGAAEEAKALLASSSLATKALLFVELFDRNSSWDGVTCAACDADDDDGREFTHAFGCIVDEALTEAGWTTALVRHAGRKLLRQCSGEEAHE